MLFISMFLIWTACAWRSVSTACLSAASMLDWRDLGKELGVAVPEILYCTSINTRAVGVNLASNLSWA